MALSRSSHNRLQAWAIRAVAGFLVVFMLGTFGIPTLIPYIAVIIAVAIDGVRCARLREPTRPRDHTRTERGETIH